VARLTALAAEIEELSERRVRALILIGLPPLPSK